jgi:hypothetical protein
LKIFRLFLLFEEFTILEDGKTLFVAGFRTGEIEKINLETKERKNNFKNWRRNSPYNNPNAIALTPDKKVLIVSNRGKNHPSGNYSIPGPEWGSILFF